MTGHLPKTMLALAVSLVVSTAIAAPASAAGGCGGPADSALNQYCESIPSSQGPQRPHPGTPAVAATLPRQVVKQLGGSASGGRQSNAGSPQSVARRSLLTLPAGSVHLRIPVRQATISKDSSLPVWLWLALIAIALALVAAAVARWRGRVQQD